MIEFINGKWTVTGPDGSIIGRFDTREAAMQAAQKMGMKTQDQQPQGQGGGMGFGGGQSQSSGQGMSFGQQIANLLGSMSGGLNGQSQPQAPAPGGDGFLSSFSNALGQSGRILNGMPPQGQQQGQQQQASGMQQGSEAISGLFQKLLGSMGM